MEKTEAQVWSVEIPGVTTPVPHARYTGFMPDTCLSKLVVIGPREDVQQFVRDAEPLPDAPGEADPSAPLSFGRLRPLRKKEDPVDVYGTKWLEPDQVSRSRIRRRRSGYEVEYQFITAWGEPYPMMEDVSKRYPTLEFILAAVAPSADCANAWFIHRGHSDNWVVPDEDRERMYKRIIRGYGAKDMDDLEGDDSWLADIEYDQKSIDFATAYWTPERRKALRAAWTRRSRKSSGRRK
jgi:hypothetical protein